MPDASYIAQGPHDLEVLVASDLELAFKKRGAAVRRDGAPGRPDIVVEFDSFAIVFELAKRSGASAASEYLAIKEHRELVERELSKTTHLVFSCLRTPARIIRAIREENVAREANRLAGRSLFLDLPSLEIVLHRLAESAREVYPAERWQEWFEAWRDIGDDVTALQRVHDLVLAEDPAITALVEPLIARRIQADQESLRKDVMFLENLLRHVNVTGFKAMQVLVHIMFVKLYEEKREGAGEPNRFTVDGFKRYRQSLPAKTKRHYRKRTLQALIEIDISEDEEVKESGILGGVQLPRAITDSFVETKLLPTLDDYRFGGTHLDALGAVFEALARRAEKDTRIGQFFTPEPIVRFAIDIVRPQETETVLDPAAGTGRFLTFSMDRMVSLASHLLPGVREERVKSIRKQQLLGTDADDWIAKIAKMNMYIHGDGKSNIKHENGLFLADVPTFSKTATLDNAVDVCLTNPPLGDLNYATYAGDVLTRSKTAAKSADEWIQKRFPMLPGEFAEEEQIRRYDKQISKWLERQKAAIHAGDDKASERAARYLTEAQTKRAEAQARISLGVATYKVSGTTAKGGALFLGAINGYLKQVRDAGEVEEWRGGRVGIIVDEAILNTPEYREARRFIRERYFIKAIFSFDRDAFWYQARTTAKTSLLYLVRKADPTVRQREPVFFAHVKKIGFTRQGKPERSDLPEMLRAYTAYEQVLRNSYAEHNFNPVAARTMLAALTLPSSVRIQWQHAEPGDVGARLDYAYEAALQLRATLPPDHEKLGDVAVAAVRNPPEHPLGVYEFATVNRNTGEVVALREMETEYAVSDMLEIAEGDIVISGIDLVHGSVGYARADVQGRVVSKEFYILRVRPEREHNVDPRYLAILLRTHRMSEMVAGTVTGTSNRTRVEDRDALLSLPLPPLPPFEEQQAIADEHQKALEQRREAAKTIATTLRLADGAWGGEEQLGVDQALVGERLEEARPGESQLQL